MFAKYNAKDAKIKVQKINPLRSLRRLMGVFAVTF
jgi:hypothetical protein